ncbi:hypothetical protein C8R46DRAFT_1226636 [Mycena filopes]|nr:hypothetical protein C8R46DRAFT_1226636 [Mycena filopes]
MQYLLAHWFVRVHYTRSGGQHPNPSDLVSILEQMNEILKERYVRLSLRGRIPLAAIPSPNTTSAWLQNVAQNLERFVDLDVWLVFADYIQTAAHLDALPYNYYDTVSAFDFEPALASPRITFSHINDMFNNICAEHFNALSGQTGTHHIDKVLVTLARLWSRACEESTVVPTAMLKYLGCRTSEDAMRRVVDAFGFDELWQGILNWNEDFRPTGTTLLNEFTEALWRVATAYGALLGEKQLKKALLVLRDLSNSAAKPSAVAVVHVWLLEGLLSEQWRRPQGTFKLTELVTMSSAHPGLPAEEESLFPVPTPLRLDAPDPTPAKSLLEECVIDKIKEAYIRLLGDFFHSCASSTASHEALKTLVCIRSLEYLGSGHPHRVHPTHQTRFSGGLQAMFHDCNDPALLEETLLLTLFDANITVLAPGSPSEQRLVHRPRYLHWLNDPSARRTVEETIFEFRPPPNLRTRARVV